MKRILSILFISSLLLSPVKAQTPKWAGKAGKAVFTLKTFRADGSLLASSNGFFIGEHGEAVSSFTPFKGAQRAVIIDAQGKEQEVTCMLGANDMYDVAKFRVNSDKNAFLTLDSTTTGGTVWLLPYTVKKTPACLRGTVSNAEKFQDKYTYYTIDMQAGEQHIGCPLLNEQGAAVGILQPSAQGKSATAYAVSVFFAVDMHIKGLSINDPTLRSTAIPLAIPDNLNDALLSLYMAKSTMKDEAYDSYLERFIQQYPNSTDGYVYRAHQHMARNDFQAADEDMKLAVSISDKKDEAHFQYAQLIYQKELYQNSLPYDGWSLSRALEESQAAYRENPHPVYLQQQAQILFAQKQYETAYNLYMELSKSTLRSADIFYAAAQCKLEQEDKKTALAMLDSAVSTFTRPYVKTASPYLQQRARLAMDLRRFHQTIEDMKEVVTLEPTDALLWAEKGSYEVRLNLNEEAQKSAEECIRLDPQNGDGYLILGIALCGKGQKAEGLQNLEKAKELGNSQAQSMIEKFSK